MTAVVVWDTTRQPVGPTYLGRPVSADKVATLNERVPGQLWERVGAGTVEKIETYSGVVVRRIYIPGE